MKVFEQKQQDGSRKLMGTSTNNIEDAVEVTLKTKDGTESTFDFSEQYHYVAPGSFAVNGTEDALGMYIDDLRIVPPITVDFEDTSEESESEESESEESDSEESESEPQIEITGIEVTTKPTKLAYTEGEALDLTGMVVTIFGTVNGEAATEIAAYNEYVTTPVEGAILTTDPTGEIEVVVSAYDFEDSFTITVATGEPELNPELNPGE